MAEKSFRYDHGELRAPREDARGFLIVEGYVGRAGIYEYSNKKEDVAQGYGPLGAIRRELRPEEEVFREDALAGFESAPVTARHPKQPVTVNNARAYSVGMSTSRGRREGNRVAASMTITDPKTIEQVKKRELNQLSPGYKATIVKKSGADKRYAYPGNPEGRYDCVQTDIEVNHLALVEIARGGEDLQIRLDGADDLSVENRADGFARLTSAVEGHQHLIDLNPSSTWGPGQSGQSGCTTWAVAEGADVGHEHPWVRNTDGTIVIGEVAGHTHTILDAGNPDARNDGTGIARAHDGSRHEGNAMTPEEQIASLKVQLADALKAADERKVSVDTAVARADAAEAKSKTFEERIAALETKIAAGAQALETEAIREHATRADAAEKKLAEIEKTREASIRKAAEVRVKALQVMGPEFRVDGMTERAIHATVIKRFAPKEPTGEEVSDAFLAQRCDSLVEAHHNTARSHTTISEAVARRAPSRENRTDSKEARAQAWRDQAINGGFQADNRQKDE